MRQEQDRQHLSAVSAEALRQGLSQMGLTLSAEQQHQLLDYLQLLLKWNTTFNLSGVRDESTMVSRHLLDSLSLLNCIRQATPECRRILDVGTGPGLPGIPLAICFPDVDFILLDSNGKKTRFVFQAKIALQLDNVTVENCRIEHYQSPAQIDIVTSRAFSSLAEMVQHTRHLQAAGDGPPLRWLAMKGTYPQEEIAELPQDIRIAHSWRVNVPGEPGERHIIELAASNWPHRTDLDPESDNK